MCAFNFQSESVTNHELYSAIKRWLKNSYYTVFQKKTPTHIIGYKLRSSCLILIIFDINIPHIIWHHMHDGLVVHLT